MSMSYSYPTLKRFTVTGNHSGHLANYLQSIKLMQVNMIENPSETQLNIKNYLYCCSSSSAHHHCVVLNLFRVG
jgi:hypothetical protein